MIPTTEKLRAVATELSAIADEIDEMMAVAVSLLLAEPEPKPRRKARRVPVKAAYARRRK